MLLLVTHSPKRAAEHERREYLLVRADLRFCASTRSYAIEEAILSVDGHRQSREVIIFQTGQAVQATNR